MFLSFFAKEAQKWQREQFFNGMIKKQQLNQLRDAFTSKLVLIQFCDSKTKVVASSFVYVISLNKNITLQNDVFVVCIIQFCD